MTSGFVSDFISQGITVIENVFNDEEVCSLRNQLHEDLRKRGVRHLEVPKEGEQDGGTRLKSKAASIFYPRWKVLDVQLSPRVVTPAKLLLLETYGKKIRGFEHPFASFTEVFAFIDRVCYRLPDCIRAEGGLELHCDRNTVDPYANLWKWRPIQGMLTLTDHYGSESGGLKVVPGFHLEWDDYFRGAKTEQEEQEEAKGEFARLTSKSHAKLQTRLQCVNAPRGSLIFWDNRLPHATCAKLAGSDSREVIYLSFLPKIALNEAYAAQQLLHLRMNIPPPFCNRFQSSASGTQQSSAQTRSSAKKTNAIAAPTGDRDWDFGCLTKEQKQLLGD